MCYSCTDWRLSIRLKARYLDWVVGNLHRVQPLTKVMGCVVKCQWKTNPFSSTHIHSLIDYFATLQCCNEGSSFKQYANDSRFIYETIYRLSPQQASSISMQAHRSRQSLSDFSLFWCFHHTFCHTLPYFAITQGVFTGGRWVRDSPTKLYLKVISTSLMIMQKRSHYHGVIIILSVMMMTLTMMAMMIMPMRTLTIRPRLSLGRGRTAPSTKERTPVGRCSSGCFAWYHHLHHNNT